MKYLYKFFVFRNVKQGFKKDLKRTFNDQNLSYDDTFFHKTNLSVFRH